MKNNLPVSIIITTHNRLELFKRAFKSVIDEKIAYPGKLEIIIVDDCSVESVSLSIKELTLSTKNLKLYRNKKNKGLAFSRNLGIKFASSELIVFLDDDDFLLPNSISIRVSAFQLLKENNTIIHAGWCFDHIGYNRRTINRNNIVNGPIREFIISDWLETHSGSVLYTKHILKLINGFDESIKSSVDHDIWFKMADYGLNAKFINKPVVVSEIYNSRTSMVNNTRKRVAGVDGFIKKWEKIMPNWIGMEKTKYFFIKYRNNVFIPLLLNKIFSLKLRDSIYIFKYLSKNHSFFKISAILFLNFFKHLVWLLTPKKAIDLIRKINNLKK